MTSPRTVRVGIDINKLGQEIACGRGDMCIDFQTGNLVRAETCPEQEVGEGRPALRQGKRFIRVPRMDDLADNWRAIYDDWESGDYEDDESLSPQDPESAKVRDLLQPGLDAAREDPGYREWCEQLNDDRAAETAARLWIRSLRPPFLVGAVEDGLGLVQVYDPETGEWEFA